MIVHKKELSQFRRSKVGRGWEADNHMLNDTKPWLSFSLGHLIGNEDRNYRPTTTHMENHGLLPRTIPLLSSSMLHKHHVKEHFSYFVIFIPHPSHQLPYLCFSKTHSECGGWDLMELSTVGWGGGGVAKWIENIWYRIQLHPRNESWW